MRSTQYEYEQALPRPPWQPGQLLTDSPLPVASELEPPSKVAQLSLHLSPGLICGQVAIKLRV